MNERARFHESGDLIDPSNMGEPYKEGRDETSSRWSLSHDGIYWNPQLCHYALSFSISEIENHGESNPAVLWRERQRDVTIHQ